VEIIVKGKFNFIGTFLISIALHASVVMSSSLLIAKRLVRVNMLDKNFSLLSPLFIQGGM